MNEIQIRSLESSKLISGVLNLVKEERELTTQVLKYLREISNRRLYAELGYPSLFIFCVKHLGYTESQAQRRIEAMRLLNQMPEIESKIKDGSLNLSNVARAQSFFRQNDMTTFEKAEVLKSLENKTTRECERTLLEMTTNPTPLSKEKVKQLTSDFQQVTLNISNGLMAKLEKIRNLMSHKNPNMTHAELIEVLADMALQKLDPVIQKQRRASAAPKVNDQRYIPKSVRQIVWQENESQCSYISKDGIKCQSRFQLQIDHIKPLARGGTSDYNNLRLLCAAHNRSEAIRIFSKRYMSQFLPGLG